MNHQTQTNLVSQDKKPALSAAEYLWLNGQKQRLVLLDSEITKAKYRLDRQTSWLLLLTLMVMLLGFCLLALIFVNLTAYP